MVNKSSNKRKPRPVESNSNELIIVKYGFIGGGIPVILGISYGAIFLESWNVWPAFIIVGGIIGFLLGLMVGLFIYLFNKK